MTQTFRALGVSDAVCDVLSERGIETPFQIQALAIPEALRGGDVLAKSPTGSGKTLAFAIPIVERLDVEGPTPAALILVPTRELASQVTEEIELVGRPLGVRVASVYGGVPLEEPGRRAPARRTSSSRRRAGSRTSSTAGCSRSTRVNVLVLDEADRMLDMGFKPQVDKIVRRLPENRQTMFFSATLDGEVGEVARRYTQHAGALRRRAAGGQPERRGRPPVHPGHARQQGADARRAAARATTGSRSSSCGRRPAPSGSCRSSAATTSTRSRSTATRRSRSASARSSGSTPARCARSSPPTSPRAGSTSTGSRT